MKFFLLVVGFTACLILNPRAWAQEGELSFSRLVIYDVRGGDREETALVLRQQGGRADIWLKNYLGRREGEVPLAEYQECFETMRKIQEFALRPKTRGKPLRANAAHGLITLAWKDAGGKQIRTIKYFAPENNQDNFRAAFNRIWALSRYAILSIRSLESPKSQFIEDAVYFLSGSGWMTAGEVQDVIAFHCQQGKGLRLARSIWLAQDRTFPAASDFSKKKYLEDCIHRSLRRVGKPAADYLQTILPELSDNKKRLCEKIINSIVP